MPDPNRQTVSASQAAVLFDASPYATRFTLYHDLRGEIAMPDEDNERMEWGRRLEPAIMQAAAERRNLIVTPNREYRRHHTHLLGATIDGEMRDVNRGPGIVEAKCVDWLQWKDKWTEDTAPPWVEIQVQAQLAVHDYQWADIACLVGGNDFRVYERERDEELIGEILERADAFMAAVTDGREPDVAGSTVEDPYIAARWPRVDAPDPLILTEDREAWEIVRQYDYWTAQESMARKERSKLKTQLLGLTQDHAKTKVWRYWVEVKKTEVAAATIERTASTQTRISVNKALDDQADPPWGDDFDAEIAI